MDIILPSPANGEGLDHPCMLRVRIYLLVLSVWLLGLCKLWLLKWRWCLEKRKRDSPLLSVQWHYRIRRSIRTYVDTELPEMNSYPSSMDCVALQSHRGKYCSFLGKTLKPPLVLTCRNHIISVMAFPSGFPRVIFLFMRIIRTRRSRKFTHSRRTSPINNNNNTIAGDVAELMNSA